MGRWRWRRFGFLRVSWGFPMGFPMGFRGQDLSSHFPGNGDKTRGLDISTTANNTAGAGRISCTSAAGGAGVGRRHWSVPRCGKGIPLLKPSMLKTGWTFRWLWNSVGFGRYSFFFFLSGSFRLPQTRVCTTTCTSINNCHNNKSKEDFDGDE